MLPNGYLRVQLFDEKSKLPIKDGSIRVYQMIDHEIEQEYFLTSDEMGGSEWLNLPAPSATLSQSYQSDVCPYAIYHVEVRCKDYQTLEINDVQLFDSIHTTLPLWMNASIHKNEQTTYTIKPHNIWANVVKKQALCLVSNLQRPVIIPQFVRVHLGNPNDHGENRNVDFIYYIKNVACSELYPTWHKEALEASIYMIISFVLQRINTAYYEQKGYDFVLTNQAEFDQTFILHRNLFDPISELVDEMFHAYLHINQDEPISICQYQETALKWRFQQLSQQGLTAMQLLHTLIHHDISIVKTNHLQGITYSYPGIYLQLDDHGEDVYRLNQWLNTISSYYESIPAIQEATTVFTQETKQAIQAFQRQFNLCVDGIVGKQTWYHVAYLVLSFRQFNKAVKENEWDDNVKGIHEALNIVGTIYSDIPVLLVDEMMDEDDQRALRIFQSHASLLANGQWTQETKEILYDTATRIKQGKYPIIGIKPYFTQMSIRQIQADDVKMIAELLRVIASYYSSLPSPQITSTFDSCLKRSLQAFQSLLGLPLTTSIDEQTWYLLQEMSLQLTH